MNIINNELVVKGSTERSHVPIVSKLETRAIVKKKLRLCTPTI